MRFAKSVIGLRQSAFTLLEVLVALVVSTLFLTMLLPVSHFSLRRIEHAADKSRALWLAKSRLEEISLQMKDADGPRKGQEGGLKWEIDVRDLPPETANDPPEILLREWRIRVIDDRSAGPLVELAMQRIYVKH